MVIRIGNTEEELAEIVDEKSIDYIFTQKEVSAEKKAIEQAVLSKTGAEVQWFWDTTLFHRDDIPYTADKIPKVFTSFRKQVEEKAKVRQCYPAPDRLPAFTMDEMGRLPSVSLKAGFILSEISKSPS